MNKITLLTPTGDRHEAFALCERWIAGQDFVGSVQWIVVDDGKEPTRVTMGQDYVRREPSRGFTLAINLATGLARVKHKNLLIIEDDDWYSTRYLSFMSDQLEQYQLAGEGRARYYHVVKRVWKVNGNTKHASLCQTGLRSELYGLLRNICAEFKNTRFIDWRLWGRVGPRDKHVFHKQLLSVGIKGLPGRKGAGIGHRPSKRYKSDEDLSKLRKWIGDDADCYAPYYNP